MIWAVFGKWPVNDISLQLLSPEDLVNACKQLDSLKLPVRLRVFESGVMVLQLHSHREEEVIIDTTDTVCVIWTRIQLMFMKGKGGLVMVQKFSHNSPSVSNNSAFT